LFRRVKDVRDKNVTAFLGHPVRSHINVQLVVTDHVASFDK